MTRVLKLVNLSNWDGEDYIVRRRAKIWKADPGEYVSNPDGQWEFVGFDTKSYDYEIVPVESLDPVKPFYLHHL